MTRKSFVLALVVTLTLTVTSTSVLAADKVRFCTTVKFNPILVLPALAAEDKGVWTKNGLDVKTDIFLRDSIAYKAVAGGSIDAGLGGTASLILGASRGVRVVLAADMQVVDYGFRVWVKPDSAVSKPRDLKGAKLGVTSYGTLPHIYGLLAISTLGLEKDVKFLALGGIRPTMAGFKAGRVDGVVLSIFAMNNLRIAGEARPVLSLVDYFPKPWSEIVTFSRKELVEEKPEVVKRIVKGVLESSDFILKNRQWTIAKLKSFFRYKGDLNWMYDRINYGKDGKIDPAALKNVRDVLIKQGLLAPEKAIPLEELYVKRFTE
jgi:ABC-type nitrate/sulfonate/bicarbonate transport system substrate-binding protein